MKQITIKIGEELFEELKYIKDIDGFIELAIAQALADEHAKMESKTACFVQPDKPDSEDHSVDNQNDKWESL